MASQTDELEVNPFYRCLQTTFNSKFQEAQQKCWIICVPQTSSMKGLKVTGQVIDYHIFKPSRYFKSQYVSTDKGESRTIEIEEGVIKVVAGNGNGHSVQIVSEELSYNQDFKQYKLYIISKPLDPVFIRKMQRLDSGGKELAEPKISYTECCSFLRSYGCHQQVLTELDKKVDIFNQNYVVLTNYLHDASRKLADIVQWGIKAMLLSHEPPLEDSNSLSLEIKSCVESYILGRVHQKVFSVIRQKLYKEDQAIGLLLNKLYMMDLMPDQLGVKNSLCCMLPTAVLELSRVNSLITPREKLYCLQKSLENIPVDIYNAFKLSENPFKKHSNIPDLSSDDLIPLLVFVLVQARVQYLESNLFYIQQFTWNLGPQDKESFSFTTFQAAKEFIKTHNFLHLPPSRSKLKKELPPNEPKGATGEEPKKSETKETSSTKDVACSSTGRATSPIDRQLERVTRMMEDSNRDLRHVDMAQGPVRWNRKFENSGRSSGQGLGDFLSSAQMGGFGISFGKQT